MHYESRPRRACRRNIALLLSALLLVLCLPPGAAAADPYRDAALSVLAGLVRLFPPAEGYVVSLPEGEVYVDLSETQLMRPGMELLVYREGDDIVHPVTGDILGKYEEKVGYLVVREVQEKYSVGTPVESSAEMRAGDKVRISARPLRTLLFFTSQSPLLDSGALAGELVEAARQSQRFRLSDEPEWLPRLKEGGMTIEEAMADTGSLRRLGEALNADLLLLVTPLKADEQAVTIEARSLWTGRVLVELSEPWSPPQEEPPPREPPSAISRLFGAVPVVGQSVQRKEYVTKNLPGEALSLALGDFSGEGALDVLVTDGRGLTLYGWEGGGLLWKWEDKGPPDRRVLFLEAGDLDGDGSAEAVVTAVRQGRLTTEVFSWGRGEWHRLGSFDGFYYRVFEGTDGGSVVLGQRGGVTDVFSGPVREYRWQDGGFQEKEGGRTLPRGTGIFGLGLVDLDGDGSLEAVALNDEGRLRVFGADGRQVSVGEGERYGGYPARVTPEDLFGPRLVDGGVTRGFFRDESVSELTGKDVERDILTAFQGKVLEANPAGPGQGATIAVPRNFSSVGKVLPNLRHLEKGETVLLQWENGRFVEQSRSRRQEGYVADIALGDADGDGKAEVFMAVGGIRGGLLAQAGGALVVWDHHLRGE